MYFILASKFAFSTEMFLLLNLLQQIGITIQYSISCGSNFSLYLRHLFQPKCVSNVYEFTYKYA